MNEEKRLKVVEEEEELSEEEGIKETETETSSG